MVGSYCGVAEMMTLTRLLTLLFAAGLSISSLVLFTLLLEVLRLVLDTKRRHELQHRVKESPKEAFYAFLR